MKIRQAIGSDAQTLSELAEVTFKDAFLADNLPESVLSYCAEAFSEQVQAREIASSDYIIWVVEHQQQLVAYAQISWQNPLESIDFAHAAEIKRIYVHQRFHGEGVAQRLMNHCLMQLEQKGCDGVWLGVWEHNPRAIAFYRKFDFYPVGEQKFLLGDEEQRDVIFARSLAKGV